MPKLKLALGTRGDKTITGRIRKRGVSGALLGKNPLVISFKGTAFFDRRIISRNWSAINDTPLTKAGNLVRTISRRSIRHMAGYKTKTGRERKASTPPTPPRSRARSKPFKLIFSVPVKRDTAVIVGMVGFGVGKTATAPVPAIHEHGLSTSVKRRVKGRRRRFPAKYPKRPFMGPALIRAKDRLPALWKRSFT